MKSLSTTKFCLPKWSLCALLSFFIFSAGIPSSSTEQKVPVQTEQRDQARSGEKLFHFVKFHQPVSQNSFRSEISFFASQLHSSNSVEACFKNRTALVLLFTPIGINLIANFLPRSGEELFS